jgi:hypothetical protein
VNATPLRGDPPRADERVVRDGARAVASPAPRNQLTPELRALVVSHLARALAGAWRQRTADARDENTCQDVTAAAEREPERFGQLKSVKAQTSSAPRRRAS